MKQPENLGTIEDLMRYRLEKAESDIKSAKVLVEAEEYMSANNRAYYAIFHAISAIHALDGNAYKKHKDAIGNFNKDYVKTGVFSREIGRKIAEAELKKYRRISGALSDVFSFPSEAVRLEYVLNVPSNQILVQTHSYLPRNR